MPVTGYQKILRIGPAWDLRSERVAPTVSGLPPELVHGLLELGGGALHDWYSIARPDHLLTLAEAGFPHEPTPDEGSTVYARSSGTREVFCWTRSGQYMDVGPEEHRLRNGTFLDWVARTVDGDLEPPGLLRPFWMAGGADVQLCSFHALTPTVTVHDVEVLVQAFVERGNCVVRRTSQAVWTSFGESKALVALQVYMPEHGPQLPDCRVDIRTYEPGLESELETELLAHGWIVEPTGA